MAIRRIRTEGEEILRLKCKPVKEVTESIRSLIDDMFETMYASDGVGLAAPQIGILRRIAVIDDTQGNKIALINPVITSFEGEQTCTEGCLSLPGYQGEVVRAKKIHVEAIDLNGKPVSFDAEDSSQWCASTRSTTWTGCSIRTRRRTTGSRRRLNESHFSGNA